MSTALPRGSLAMHSLLVIPSLSGQFIRGNTKFCLKNTHHFGELSTQILPQLRCYSKAIDSLYLTYQGGASCCTGFLRALQQESCSMDINTVDDGHSTTHHRVAATGSHSAGFHCSPFVPTVPAQCLLNRQCRSSLWFACAVTQGQV